jgi:anti-sigma-K factor RskA
VLESHLADCPRCRAELESLRDVAALLGNSGLSAPQGTWDRIASELGLPPADQAVPVLAFQSRRRTPVWRNAALAVAAVVVVVLGLLSYRVVNLDNRVGQLQASLGERGVGQLVTLALENPASREVELSRPRLRRCERTSCSCPMALPTGLTTTSPRCRRGNTYQLWALASGKVVSLGVLGPAPHDVPFRVEPTMTLLMVTAEPAGGTPVPTTAVVAQGALSA